MFLAFEENLPGPSVTDSARKVNKRKFNIGDFKSENDLESPNSRRKLFHAAQTSHKKYQSTIRKLRMQNLNLKKKILNLGQLIDHLKSDNKINESCFSFLKVSNNFVKCNLSVIVNNYCNCKFITN